jgi:hypothetical protein
MSSFPPRSCNDCGCRWSGFGQFGLERRREIAVQDEMDVVVVIKKGVGVGDRIVLDGIRQVRDGEIVEYEFRPPEEVMRKMKGSLEFLSTGGRGRSL